MNKNSSVFTTLESSLSEIDNILGKKVSIFEALESSIDMGINNLGLREKFTFAALESAIDMGMNNLGDELGSEEKFTFAAFESFIDEAIKNLDVAEESSMLDTLLQTAKNTIETKCKSVEDCDNMLNVIATEAAKFNTCMESMANAGKELKSGSITKEEFKEKIAPAINELKANCETLGIANEGFMDKFKKKPSEEEEAKMIEKVEKMSDMQLLKAYVPILKSEKNLVNDKAMLEELVEDDKDDGYDSIKIVTIDGTLFLVYHKNGKLDSVTYCVRGKHLARLTSTEKMKKAIIAKMKSEMKGAATESSVTISDEHISTMREFIIGTRNLLNEKKLSFGGEVEVDASLEGFISSCESMTIATEGVTSDVSDIKKKYKPIMEELKTKMQEAKAKGDKNELRTVILEHKKTCQEFKNEVKNVDESDIKKLGSVILSLSLNVVLARRIINAFRAKKYSSEDMKVSDALVSNMNKVWTINELNRLIKRDDELLKELSEVKDVAKESLILANESVDTLDDFLVELALESYNDDEDDCCDDDDDLDETSYDCYLK